MPRKLSRDDAQRIVSAVARAEARKRAEVEKLRRDELIVLGKTILICAVTLGALVAFGFYFAKL